MARKRFRLNGLVSHTTPDGKSRLGEREILTKKFNNNTITEEEKHKLICLMLLEKKHKKPATSTPKEVIVSLNGFGTLRMKFTDYQLRGNGLSIVAKIW